LTTDGITYRCW